MCNKNSVQPIKFKKHLLKEALLPLFVLFSLLSSAQTVEIVHKSIIVRENPGITFDYLESATDTTFLDFVAVIQAKGKTKKVTLEILYDMIREKGNELGANCFKVNSFTRDKNYFTLRLVCYYTSNKVLNDNDDNHQKNVVYIFGKENENERRTLSVSINDRYFDIKPGMYLKSNLEKGKTMKINRGGPAGTTEWLEWEDSKMPVFYTIIESKIRSYTNSPGRVGEDSFNIYIKGDLNHIEDINLGLLLAHLLKKIS